MHEAKPSWALRQPIHTSQDPTALWRGVRRVRGAGGPSGGRPRARPADTGCAGRPSRGPDPPNARGSSSTPPRAPPAVVCRRHDTKPRLPTVPDANRTSNSNSYLPHDVEWNAYSSVRDSEAAPQPGAEVQ